MSIFFCWAPNAPERARVDAALLQLALALVCVRGGSSHPLHCCLAPLTFTHPCLPAACLGVGPSPPLSPSSSPLNHPSSNTPSPPKKNTQNIHSDNHVAYLEEVFAATDIAQALRSYAPPFPSLGPAEGEGGEEEETEVLPLALYIELEQARLPLARAEGEEPQGEEETAAAMAVQVGGDDVGVLEEAPPSLPIYVSFAVCHVHPPTASHQSTPPPPPHTHTNRTGRSIARPSSTPPMPASAASPRASTRQPNPPRPLQPCPSSASRPWPTPWRRAARRARRPMGCGSGLGAGPLLSRGGRRRRRGGGRG